MSEGRAAFDVAESVDAFYIGLQFIVRLDEAAIVGSNASGGKVQFSVFGTRPVATSRCEPEIVRTLLPVRTVSLICLPAFRHAFGLRIQQNRYAVLL